MDSPWRLKGEVSCADILRVFLLAGLLIRQVIRRTSRYEGRGRSSGGLGPIRRCQYFYLHVFTVTPWRRCYSHNSIRSSHHICLNSWTFKVVLCRYYLRSSCEMRRCLTGSAFLSEELHANWNVKQSNTVPGYCTHGIALLVFVIRHSFNLL